MSTSTNKKKLELIPIRVSVKKKRFDLFKALLKAVEVNGEEIQDGDIFAISSKFVAMSQGKTVPLDSLKPGGEALKLASSLYMSSRLAELVVREADILFGGVPGFALTIKNGVIAPNAGIDKSNIYSGYAILHPSDPFSEAEILRKKILLATGKKVGIVFTDSRLMPTRSGTIGVALAVSGFEPIKDERGRRDLFGNILRVTQRAIADDISAATQLLMGEADEAIPIVIVRNSGIEMVDRAIYEDELKVGFDQCIYVRGLAENSLIDQHHSIQSA